MPTHGAYLGVDVVVIIILLAGVAIFRTPASARYGTLAAALAMLVAVISVLVRMDVHRPEVIAAMLVIGSLCGLGVAVRVNMLGIPAMIAFQHGAGALAALLVSFVELWRGAAAGLAALPEAAGLAGLVIGAGTLSASLIAGAKLANLLSSRPVVLASHSLVLLGSGMLTIGLAVLAGFVSGAALAGTLTAAVIAGVLGGVVVSMRIGGADMPVLISTLNATAGFAAAFCGIILGSHLLVAAGAIVAASGTVLTQVMCKAMNRNLIQVLAGIRPRGRGQEAGVGDAVPAAGAAQIAPTTDGRSGEPVDAASAAVEVLRSARNAIIVPGYGMAIAQAQFELVSLARRLEQNGAEVRYAIHPVAGRMPGHMNVLLAEADVPYDQLVEMDAINPDFAFTDLALVVGACDVVNPAAVEGSGTPISGMPILRAMDAKTVIVCNYDDKPGYSGVGNPLYERAGSILLWGDAKETLGRLNGSMGETM